MDNDVYSQVRDDFVAPVKWGDNETKVDLRALNLGLMPVSVRDRSAEFEDAWATQNLSGWWDPKVDWGGMPEHLGEDHIRPLLNAEPGTCIMVPSVTHVL